MIMLWDAHILKKYNRDHFVAVFRQMITVGVLVFCGAMMLISAFKNPSTMLAYLFLACLVPAYLAKRNLFFYTDPQQPMDFLTGKDDHTKSYTLFEGFKVALLSLYGASIFAIILQGVLRYLAIELSEISELMISVIFFTVFTSILIYRSAYNFSPESFWSNVGFKKGTSKIKSVLVPVFVGLFFVGFASLVVLSRGDNQPSTPMNETISTAGSPLVILFFLAWAWFVAPLFEEIVFRGYGFHILKKVKGQRFAVYVIAFSFAFLHIGQYWGDWLAILMVLFLAFALTLLRVWSGTTLAGLITHYIYNLGVTLVPVVVMTMNNPFYFEYQMKYTTLNTTQKEELLLKSIQHRPDLSQSYNDLAWLYSQEKIKLEEAAWLIERALELSPDNDMYLDTKAEILEVGGHYAEALEIRRGILERSGDGYLKDLQKERIEKLEEQVGQT